MHNFNPGDTINNRYTVIRKLGAGAMGSVYLCEDGVEKNIKVALKVLVSENLEDQDIWAKGEYEALTRLRHPNLARVYNFGRIEGSGDYFIVSEFIKGLDLYSMTEFVNYAEVVDIIVQVCRALEYIHSQGYVHFDIKPDNILVTRRKTIGIKEGSKVQYDEAQLQSSTSFETSKPVVKLIDFGLAEKITGSFSFAIKGTLNYLAPEMLNGLNPDKRADLYSLGVTIYQIVNRDLPFQLHLAGSLGEGSAEARTKRSELFEAHMKKHPAFLRELILRLLEENPDDRFQNAKEVIQFINKNSEYRFELETEETRESYFHSARLVGRKKEMALLKRHHELIFFPQPSSRAAPEAAPEASAPADASPDGAPAFGASDANDARVAQILLISGEMGSGKSRLLEEFKHYLKLNDLTVYSGNCYESNQKAYQPMVEILRQVVYGLGLDSEICRRYERTILKLLPELAERRKDLPVEAAYRPEKEKHQFIETISQLLVEAAHRVPNVMVINNVHWIDEASVDLLERVFERMLDRSQRGDPVKLMVLVSQRGEEQTSERVKELCGSLAQNDFLREVWIRRLKHDQIREFLQAMLSITDVPEDFVTRLEEQTGGNPLFIVETLKALEDEGIVKKLAGGWSVKTTKYTRVAIPQRMEDLLLKRLDRLDPEKRQVLEVMAVLNKPVRPKLLQRFARFREAPVLVRLRDLEAAGIVQKIFENNKLYFEIEQPKVREILCASLDEEVLRNYHGEIGEVYEEVYRHREEEILEELAYHYQSSNKAEKGIQLALRAGDRLKAIYASDKAYEHYAFVLEHAGNDPQYLEAELEVREKLGEVCTTMGRYQLADEHYRDLLEGTHRSLLSPERVTALFLRRGKIFEIQGDYESALRYYKEARNHLAAFEEDHQLVDRARVYNSIGWVYVCMGKYEKAMTISLEALRVLDDLPDEMERARSYSTIGSANYFKGNIQEAIKYHRRSLEIKEHVENVPEIVVSLNNLGSAHLEGAEYMEALEHFRRALSTSEEIGDPYGQGMSLHNLARLHARIGDIERAEEYLEESLRQAKLHNMRYLNLQNYLVRGTILRAREDYAKAERDLFRVLTPLSKQGNRAGVCPILLEVAEVHRLHGKLRDARTMVDEAARTSADLGLLAVEARCFLEKARQLRLEEEHDRNAVLELLEKAREAAERGDDPELTAEIWFETAETLVAQHEVSRAAALYKSARERFREIGEGLPPELRAHYEARQARLFRRTVPGSSDPQAASSDGAPPSREEPREPRRNAVTPQESLRRVHQLMRDFQNEPSLARSLGKVLEEVVDVSQADVGFILSVSGRNLSIMASRKRGGGRPAQPAKMLCIPLIHEALRAQQPVLVRDISDDVEASRTFQAAGLEGGALAIHPFQEPGGRSGAVYLMSPAVGAGGMKELSMVVSPFIHLLPMAFLHFQSSRDLVSGA